MEEVRPQARAQALPVLQALNRAGLALTLILCAAGAFASLWRPSPQWVERSFSNGYYPHWQGFWSSITPLLPFSLGDVVVLIGLAAVIFVAVRAVRATRASHTYRPLARAIAAVAAIAGFYALWFYAGWGWGYDRAPVQVRVAYRASRVNASAVGDLRKRAVAQMNALAPFAHALRRGDDVDLGGLQAAWSPVVMRLGDDWAPRVGPSKPTLAEIFMDASGTSGFTNPFTLETQLAPDVLWFERPFSQAHEWSHVAGYNREDEANYIAVLTCLRDSDPVARYSGWLELFLYLPPLKHYSRATFVSQVWQDFAAIRARNAHFVNLNLSRFSWRVYNRYLQTNHIASGVENYNEVTLLMAGIALDAAGLPIRAASPGRS